MLWPDPICSVVSARRVVMPGTTKPFRVTALLESSCDTSGRTCSEISPLASTVGVKARLTP